jgi:hypothetical protein
LLSEYFLTPAGAPGIAVPADNIIDAAVNARIDATSVRMIVPLIVMMCVATRNIQI